MMVWPYVFLAIVGLGCLFVFPIGTLVALGFMLVLNAMGNARERRADDRWR